MSDSTNPFKDERDRSPAEEAISAAQGARSSHGNQSGGGSDQQGNGSKTDRVGALEAQLAETKAELEKFRDLALRSSADLDNYRKRMAKEREEAIKFANSSFLERLIPVLDNFEFGLQAARSASSPESILDGMSMVQKQFHDFLASAGIEIIDATGQRFDPQLHEAIAQEENEAPEGTVVRQLRKGYKLRERLIRPANVVVSKGAPVEISTGSTEP